MKDTFYFQHDYNAIQDPKMMSLLFDCGLAGIGIYWIIIEILHQQENGTITEDELRNYICFYSKFEKDQQVLNKIKDLLMTSGLLIKMDHLIGSNRVMRNKQYRSNISEKRSIAGKKSAELRIKSAIQQNPTSVEQNPTKERKGKERKYSIIDHPFDFESLWNKYPRRIGKKKAEAHFRASVKTEEDFKNINTALDNYLRSDTVAKGESQYIQHGKTWFNNWHDYLDVATVTGKSRALLELEEMTNNA